VRRLAVRPLRRVVRQQSEVMLFFLHIKLGKMITIYRERENKH
jgi:hypothetical protein